MQLLSQWKLITKIETKVIAGLPRVREKSGKFNFFQGQGIVGIFQTVREILNFW